jgi:hypothetical protein
VLDGPRLGPWPVRLRAYQAARQPTSRAVQADANHVRGNAHYRSDLCWRKALPGGQRHSQEITAFRQDPYPCGYGMFEEICRATCRKWVPSTLINSPAPRPMIIP